MEKLSYIYHQFSHSTELDFFTEDPLKGCRTKSAHVKNIITHFFWGKKHKFYKFEFEKVFSFIVYDHACIHYSFNIALKVLCNQVILFFFTQDWTLRAPTPPN